MFFPRLTAVVSRGLVRSTMSRTPAGANKKQLFLRQLTTIDTARVGFVGLGNMGLPMSINLAKEDLSVLAFDVNPDSCTSASSHGVSIASSAGEIAESDCQVIFTMLPGCDTVSSTMAEMLEAVKGPKVVVDCSTVSPTTSREWHAKWTQAGHSMLDAPVSGGVKGATDGTLTFMVGTDHEHGMDKAQPYLDIMGQRSIYCGGAGAGAATKLCNNLALATQMIGICEAMNLGEALGVDPNVLADVMNISTAKCWSCEVNNPHPEVALAKTLHGVGPPAARDYAGGFGTRLMLKDLGLAVAAADSAGVAMPLTALSKELYRMVKAHGLGDKDFGVMLQFLKGKSVQ